MIKIPFFFLTLLLASCILLNACTCSGVITTTTPPTSTTSTTSSTTTTSTPPVSGGTLKLSGTDPTTLDPATTTDSGYIAQIFSGLVKLDKDLKPAADIAESWDISGDGRTFTFYLRNDVVFQDGRKVTAADFKYSWERACSPATRSITAATYLGDIVGVKDMLAGRAGEISGVEVVNDYTLRVTIDAAKSYFLSKMTYPTAMVVDGNNVAEGGEWWRKPNGTGPFKLKEWVQSTSLVLERNDFYYGKVASLDSVEYQMYTGVPVDLYETGDIDVAGVSADYIDKVTDEKGVFYTQLHESPILSFSYIGFNTHKPPFDDVNIRQAFIMAVDMDKIIDLSLRNMVQHASGVLPPGMPGYNENLAGTGFNVNRAKELIAASSYGSVANLPAIVYTTSGYGGAISSTMEAIITQWHENLGVEVTVRQLEPERYIYNLKAEVDNMFDMGWIADYPHPQDFLDVLFHTDMEYNFGSYSNAAFDALVDEAGVEQDTTASLQKYRQAEQMLVDDAVLMPLWFNRNYILVKPYVIGYELNAMGYVMLNEVSLLAH